MSDDLESGVTGTGPMSSVTRDVRTVQANSATTAKELRAFLSQMKGKSPTEMLGLVAQSNLFKSTISAAVLMVAVILLFTIIPFVMNMVGGDRAEKVAAAVVTASEETGVPAKPAAGTDEPAADSTTPAPKASLEDTLGIGEALDAPADINPLENTGDDLFKDLE